MKGMRLLREFIRENMGSMFGLDRHVTMNALQDVVGGPSGVSPLSLAGHMRSDSQDMVQNDATTRLNGSMVDQFDELDDDLEQTST